MIRFLQKCKSLLIFGSNLFQQLSLEGSVTQDPGDKYLLEANMNTLTFNLAVSLLFTANKLSTHSQEPLANDKSKNEK